MHSLSLLLFADWFEEMVRVCDPVDDAHSPEVARLGLAGEAGEVLDLFKKSIRNKTPLPLDKVHDELGDVLFYVMQVAFTTPGISLNRVFAHAIWKYRTRFPNGFDPKASANQTDKFVPVVEREYSIAKIERSVERLNPALLEHENVNLPYPQRKAPE